MKWSFVLPWPTPHLNHIKQLDRSHWSKVYRLKKEWLQALALKANGIPKAKGKRRVTIVRFGVRELDYDNFVGGCKEVVVDNMRAPGGTAKRRRHGLGLIVDDDSAHAEIVYVQVKCKKEQQRTEITLEDCPNGVDDASQ